MSELPSDPNTNAGAYVESISRGSPPTLQLGEVFILLKKAKMSYADLQSYSKYNKQGPKGLAKQLWCWIIMLKTRNNQRIKGKHKQEDLYLSMKTQELLQYWQISVFPFFIENFIWLFDINFRFAFYSNQPI